MSFSVTEERRASATIIRLTGTISESSEFKHSGVEGVERLSIEWGAVKYVNSAGVRRLFKWIWDLEKSRPKRTIHFDRVPPFIVKQLLSLRAHLPQVVRVESCFLPFYCDNCDVEDSSRLLTSHQLSSGMDADTLASSGPICSSCSEKMDFDFDAEQLVSLMTSNEE